MRMDDEMQQQFLLALSGDHSNNYTIAKQFNMSPFEIMYLRNNFPTLYQITREVKDEIHNVA